MKRGSSMKKRRGSLVLIVIATLGLSACAGANPDRPADGAPASDVVLTWETTGGEATEKEKHSFQDPYTEKTGVRFENVSSPSAVNQIQTMVETGNVLWDVTHKGSHIAARYCGVLFEKLEFETIPDDIYPEGSTSDCARPLQKYGTAFAYDHEVYTDKVPTEIGDFFDVDTFPGKRVVYGSNPRGVFEAALVADGVMPEDLYPLDVDRAIAKLDTIKNDMIFAPTLTALQQNIVDKQASMTLALTGRLGTIYDSGGTITPVWDYTSWDFDALLVPLGSKNKEDAAKAIEFALQPEQIIRYAETNGGTPAREDIELSTINYSDTHRIFNPFLNADKGRMGLLDPVWWSENIGSASEAYVEWQVG
jgi:putative spermidine/putrescine transport system substrate-binding protein